MKPLSVPLALCVASIVLLLPGRVSAQLMLDELLRRANATHPVIHAARADARSREHDVEAAKLRRFPSINARVEAGREVAYGMGRSRVVDVQQSIWDGGRVRSLIEAAEAASIGGEANVEARRQQVFLEVVMAWRGVLLARQKMQILSKAQDTLVGYEEQIRRKVAAGGASKAELDLVSLRVEQGRAELQSIRSDARILGDRLQRLTGDERGALPLDLEQVVEPADGDVEAEWRWLESVDVDSMVDVAPSVRNARAERDSARSQLDAKRAERWPNVYLRVGRSFGPNASNAFEAFVGMSYTPDAGFSHVAVADSIAARVESMERAIEAAARQFRLDFNVDREEYVRATAQIVSLKSVIESGTSVIDSYYRQFNAGRKSLLDLLNTVRERSQYEVSLADARMTRAAMVYRMKILLGRIDFLGGAKVGRVRLGVELAGDAPMNGGVL